MRKLALSLTLLLCLVLSMLAFASCGEPEPDGCSHEWAAEATVDKASTCTVAGSKSVKCSVCGEKKADTIEALPLAEHTWNAEATVDIPSTCTVAGSKSIKCTACGEKKADSIEALPLANHEWDTIPTIDREPTCEAEGSKSVKCVVCFQPNPDSVTPIETLEHDWADVATEDKAPTCTEDGVKTIKCKECSAKKPGSEEPIPAAHSWGSVYSVDYEPTCDADGSKSLKCTVDGCGAKKPGSEIAIPANHTVEDGEMLAWPTLFTKGEKYGACSACGAEGVTAYVDELEPSIEIIDSSYSGTFVKKWRFSDSILTGGNHFYPTEDDPDGKSLFIEFSFLWNETLKNNVYEQYITFARIANSGGSDHNSFWWFNCADDIEDQWCQYEGGFEPTEGTVTFGPDMPKDGGTKEDYPSIGEYGWHRIGIEISQTAEIVNGAVKYTLETSLYIDGVKVAAYIPSIINEKNYLYTAEIVDGKLEYTDIGDDRYLYIYRIGEAGTRGNNKAYFGMGDLSVRCADKFAQYVEPLTEPVESVIEVEPGVYLDATVFYKLSENTDDPTDEPDEPAEPDEPDVPAECTKHVDANDDYVCDNEGCEEIFFDGCDTKDCLDTDDDGLCDNDDCDKITANKPEPDACKHEGVAYTVIPTLFSEGQKNGHCDECGKDVSFAAPKSEPEIYTFTTDKPATGQAGHTYKTFSIVDEALGEGQVFYPAEENNYEGRDLYLEFSILFNESLEKLNKGTAYIGSIGANGEFYTSSNDRPIWFGLKTNTSGCDCTAAGGFETLGGSVTKGDYSCKPGNNSTFPYVGEYGWHRIGLKYHLEIDWNGTTPEYTTYITVYIDGEEVVEFSFGGLREKSLLYTAEKDSEGNITYTNIDSEMTIDVFRMIEDKANSDKAYLVIGDAYVSAGDGFVLDVEPVENPEAATLTVADGVNLDARVHFAVK